MVPVVPVLVDQNSSKSTNVRCAAISRVSTASSPAAVHSSRSAFMRDISTLGGIGGIRPCARNSTRIGSNGKSPFEHIPRIRRDRSAGANHPHHFGDALGRLGNEEDHQRHRRGIEAVVGEWQRHRVAQMKRCVARAGAAACEHELRFGRIDPLRLRGCAALHQQLGEGAAAAADVQPSQAGRGASQSRKIWPASALQTPMSCS